MKLNIIAIVALAAAPTAPATAQDSNVGIYTTGEQITKSCRAYKRLAEAGNKTSSAQDAYDAGMCLAAVTMVVDVDALHRDSINYTEYFPKFCLPGNANSGAMAEVVANFVDAHPELRTLAGYPIIRRALASAWPCPGQE